MKLPRTNVGWVDGAGIVVLALMTAGLYALMIRPALDLGARDDELRDRLVSMRSNLTALRARACEFEGRVEEARHLVEDQPPLERSDTLLTRRAVLTSLLAEHNLLLNEFEAAPVSLPASPASATAPSGRRAGAAAPAPPDTPDDRGAAESFARQTLTLRGEGTFPDIGAMMIDLRAQFADTLIEAIEITGHPLGSSDQRRFTLKLVWYASRAPGA